MCSRSYVQNFIVPLLIVAVVCTLLFFSRTVSVSSNNVCTVVDFLQVYFQACKGASARASGVDVLSLALVLGICLILTGASIAISKAYRPQLWVSWVFLIISMGVLTTLDADSPRSAAIGYAALVGVGGGICYASTWFPVLAPLPVTENAHALAFFGFCRSFAGVSLL